MAKTKNLSLNLFTDSNILFKNFRELLCGQGEGTESSPFSNMQIIDENIGTIVEKISAIETILTSNDADLDTLQELVTALKKNVNNIGSLFDQIATKADKELFENFVSGVTEGDIVVAKAEADEQGLNIAETYLKIEKFTQDIENLITQLQNGSITVKQAVADKNGKDIAENYATNDSVVAKLQELLDKINNRTIDLPYVLKDGGSITNLQSIDQATIDYLSSVLEIPASGGTGGGGGGTSSSSIDLNGFPLLNKEKEILSIEEEGSKLNLGNTLFYDLNLNSKTRPKIYTLNNQIIVPEEIAYLSELVLLQNKITQIEQLLTSNDTDLDTLQELVNALKNNVNDIGTLFEHISSKVDKEEGKGLSSNDYTDAEKEKLRDLPTNEELEELLAQAGTGSGGGGGGISAAILDVNELPSPTKANSKLLYRKTYSNHITWAGTEVPNKELVEKVYLNTSITTKEEFIEIASKITNYNEDGAYCVLVNSDTTSGIAIIYLPDEDYYGICDLTQSNIYLAFGELATEVGFEGWNPEFNGVLELNIEPIKEKDGVKFGNENYVLSSLISITPFEEIIDTKTSLHHFKDGLQFDIQNNMEDEFYALWDIILGDDLEQEYPQDLESGGGISVKIVASLPQVGEKKYIYLVPNNSNKPNNIYEEYLWSEELGAFELVGSTQIDLSGYYTKEEVDTKLTEIDLSVYYNKTEVDTKLNDKVNTTTLNNYYTKSQMNSTLNNYYTKSTMDSKLNDKVNNTDLSDNYYNKTEVDTKLTQIDLSAYYTKEEINTTFQAKLKAGNGISIAEDGTISINLEIAEEGSY